MKSPTQESSEEIRSIRIDPFDNSVVIEKVPKRLEMGDQKLVDVGEFNTNSILEPYSMSSVQEENSVQQENTSPLPTRQVLGSTDTDFLFERGVVVNTEKQGSMESAVVEVVNGRNVLKEVKSQLKEVKDAVFEDVIEGEDDEFKFESPSSRPDFDFDIFDENPDSTVVNCLCSQHAMGVIYEEESLDKENVQPSGEKTKNLVLSQKLKSQNQSSIKYSFINRLER